jgi:hypothetical protein
MPFNFRKKAQKNRREEQWHHLLALKKPVQERRVSQVVVKLRLPIFPGM